MRISKYSTILDDDRLCQLVKEKQVEYRAYSGGKRLDCSESVVTMLREVFNIHRQSEEYVYLLCFNTKMHPLGVFEVSHGTVAESASNPREIIQKALLCNASCIIIAHNHPSGECMPSAADHRVFERMQQACELVGLIFADSIIVCSDSYYSFAEEDAE